jgi:hypothetical protein
MRNCLIEKAEPSLPFLFILYVDVKASNALLRRLTYPVLDRLLLVKGKDTENG